MEQEQKLRGVIIPAAGRGVRFGSAMPKQFLLLAGTPIIVHSVRTALGLTGLHSLVIAVHSADVSFAANLLEQAGINDPRVHLVAGSTERQKSVGVALQHESLTDVHTILVHDAVRPLASLLLWDRVATASEAYGAVVPALRAAYASPDWSKANVTDCSAIVEQNGNIVASIAGEESNIKVTTPNDLEMAEIFFARSLSSL